MCVSKTNKVLLLFVKIHVQKKSSDARKLIFSLQKIKPDIDFETCTTLIDDALLDSFDIISIVGALNEAYDMEIPVAEIFSRRLQHRICAL